MTAADARKVTMNALDNEVGDVAELVKTAEANIMLAAQRGGWSVVNPIDKPTLGIGTADERAAYERLAKLGYQVACDGHCSYTVSW